MARGDRGGLSFLEVVVASVIVAVAIPPLVETWITVGKVDAGQLERGYASNLSQVVLEQIHYRMYLRRSPAVGQVRSSAPAGPALVADNP